VLQPAGTDTQRENARGATFYSVFSLLRMTVRPALLAIAKKTGAPGRRADDSGGEK
jgi:hypothetical protein